MLRFPLLRALQAEREKERKTDDDDDVDRDGSGDGDISALHGKRTHGRTDRRRVGGGSWREGRK